MESLLQMQGGDHLGTWERKLLVGREKRTKKRALRQMRRRKAANCVQRSAGVLAPLTLQNADPTQLSKASLQYSPSHLRTRVPDNVPLVPLSQVLPTAFETQTFSLGSVCHYYVATDTRPSLHAGASSKRGKQGYGAYQVAEDQSPQSQVLKQQSEGQWHRLSPVDSPLRSSSQGLLRLSDSQVGQFALHKPQLATTKETCNKQQQSLTVKEATLRTRMAMLKQALVHGGSDL